MRQMKCNNVQSPINTIKDIQLGTWCQSEIVIDYRMMCVLLQLGTLTKTITRKSVACPTDATTKKFTLKKEACIWPIQ